VLGSGLACEAVPVCPLDSDTGDGDAGATGCAIPFAKGDGWCDAANNVPACDYVSDSVMSLFRMECVDQLAIQ
jgi:hypothetical protein